MMIREMGEGIELGNLFDEAHLPQRFVTYLGCLRRSLDGAKRVAAIRGREIDPLLQSDDVMQSVARAAYYTQQALHDDTVTYDRQGLINFVAKRFRAIPSLNGTGPKIQSFAELLEQEGGNLTAEEPVAVGADQKATISL
ncbi:MAG: hypothetical protein DHS20C02_20650 [Micavibrio sp.]|nr:MAG: hypothetical protein DHS20C02_20650 [Micavibrio sp.]